MSNKVEVKGSLVIFLILCLLISILISIQIDTTKRIDKKTQAKRESVIPATDTVNTDYDLYYLKHPYLIQGDRLNDEGNYDSAIYYYKEASLKFENEHQWENYVWVNGYIGRLYLYIAGKNFEDALPYLQKAFEKGKQNLSSNHPYMAITYYYFGLYYYSKKLPDKSLEMLNKALHILLNDYKKDNIYTSDVYNAIGDVYAGLMFDNIVAEANYLKSIKIKEALPGEEKKSLLTSGYYNLVKLSFSIGDFEKAQSYCYEAIKNAQYVKSHRFYWLELLEGVLAGIYSEQQIFEKAIDKLNNVIRINYENNGDKSYLSFYYTSIGDIYSRTTKYDSAIIYYKKALSLTHTNTLFYEQEEQAAVTNYSLGMTFLKLRNTKTALSYLTKCLDIRLKIYGKKQRETAIAFQGIGSAYQEAGLADSALKYFQSALMTCTKNFNDSNMYSLPVASAINNSYTSFQIIRDKASALKQLYYNHPLDSRLLHTSLAYYCLADTLMTLFRAEYHRENAKLVFSKNNNGIYEEAIDCATALYQLTKESKYHDLVFNFMDKRKSSLLLEALNEKELLELAGIPTKEQNAIRSLQQEIAFLESQLEKENSKENLEESVLKAIHARINITEAKFNELYEKLSKAYPYYASVQQRDDTVRLKDIQASSDRNNSLVLEYFWGDKVVFVLGIYKGGSRLLKIDRSIELDRYLDTLRANLARGYVFATKENDFVSFQRSSFYIYNSLVKPIFISFNAQIKESIDKPKIIVIPDGPLYYIPFEVLVTTPGVTSEIDYRKLNYLLNSYVISYDYSTRLLLRNDSRPNTSRNPEVLALGFSKEQALKNREGKLKALNKYDTAELPGTAREIKAISSFLKGQFYMGDDATEYLFKKEAPNYDILHLAVHGESDSLHSYSSRLIFKKGNDSLNDGNLYTYEIYNLPIKARLAVLSACESGIGKLNPGEGIFSIARGFAYAGCPSVIISYWRVNDNPTQFIISDFYRQIAGGDKIDQSLRKAKLDYINNADHRTAHPANWAAFIAIGDMAPLVKKSSPGNPILFTIMIIIFLGIGVYLVSRNYSVKK